MEILEAESIFFPKPQNNFDESKNNNRQPNPRPHYFLDLIRNIDPNKVNFEDLYIPPIKQTEISCSLTGSQ